VHDTIFYQTATICHDYDKAAHAHLGESHRVLNFNKALGKNSAIKSGCLVKYGKILRKRVKTSKEGTRETRHLVSN
jgi:hypothetical protein